MTPRFAYRVKTDLQGRERQGMCMCASDGFLHVHTDRCLCVRAMHTTVFLCLAGGHGIILTASFAVKASHSCLSATDSRSLMSHTHTHTHTVVLYDYSSSTNCPVADITLVRYIVKNSNIFTPWHLRFNQSSAINLYCTQSFFAHRIFIPTRWCLQDH